MAVVNCLPVNSKSHLMNLLNYVQRDNKTMEKEFVTSVDCHLKTAYSDFELTKKLANKTDGILAHQVIQSFKIGEVEPEQAHEISCRFAEKMFPGFQYTVCTHVDREHIHSHIILNSVSMETGKKYCSNLSSLKLLRDESDKLCREYGLDVIAENSGLRALDKSTYEIAAKGKSWKVAAASSLDRALATCRSKEEFISFLVNEGYGVEWKNVHIVLNKDGNKIRVNTLAKQFGMQYHKANIEKVLGITSAQEAPERVLRSVPSDEGKSVFAQSEEIISKRDKRDPRAKAWDRFMKFGSISKYELIHSAGETSTITVSVDKAVQIVQPLKQGRVAYAGMINSDGTATISFKEKHNGFVAEALGLPVYEIKTLTEKKFSIESNRLIRSLAKQGNLELYRMTFNADEIKTLSDNNIPFYFYRNGTEFKTVFFQKDLHQVCSLLGRDYNAELQHKEFQDNRITYSKMKKVAARREEPIQYRVVDHSGLELLRKQENIRFAYFPAKAEGKYNLAMLPADLSRYDEWKKQQSAAAQRPNEKREEVPVIHRNRSR